ncbi:MAG: hypothetical protein WCI73_19605, partial [Phycisphaerae bacterium]
SFRIRRHPAAVLKFMPPEKRTAVNTTKPVIDPADRTILRSLAQSVADLAARPIEKTKRDLWYRHNDLEATRPLIFCDPENGWHEIVRDSDLQCTGPLARGWENHLRKEIFWGREMKDDRVIEPYFNIGHVHEKTDWGMHETRIGGEHGGAFTWVAPLQDYAQLDKLRYPTIQIDTAATEHLLELAQSVLGDLLEVRLRTGWWWTLGLTTPLVNLRGLEQIMLDMIDTPDELKQLMAFLRDGHLAMLDFLETQGLLSPNHAESYVGSGGFGYTRTLPAPGFDPKHVRTQDMWGFAESQETVGVSPDMFAEFVFPYQLPLLERFGLNCYGCCEPLDKRWHIVKDAPRLRRVSVSPWANLEVMAAALQDRYIFSYKPSPTDLATPHMNEDYVRTNFRRALEITRGCRLEIVMKDNHTLGGSSANAVRWCQIVREEIRRAYGE